MRNAGGYIALISVLVASALFLLLGTTVTLRGIDASQSVIAEESASRARWLADSCAEEALLRLRADLGYTGGEFIMVTGGESCLIRGVSGSGNTDRIIRAEGTAGGYARAIAVDVARVNPFVVIRSWALVDPS